MKLTKKIFAVVLSVLMVVSVMPMTAIAAEETCSICGHEKSEHEIDSDNGYIYDCYGDDCNYECVDSYWDDVKESSEQEPEREYVCSMCGHSESEHVIDSIDGFISDCYGDDCNYECLGYYWDEVKQSSEQEPEEDTSIFNKCLLCGCEKEKHTFDDNGIIENCECENCEGVGNQWSSWVTDSNRHMMYGKTISNQFIECEAPYYYTIGGKVKGKWHGVTYANYAMVPYILNSNNVSVVSCTPTFIDGGKAIDLVYTVKNDGTRKAYYRFNIWSDTKVAGNDRCVNETSSGRDTITMSTTLNEGEASEYTVSFYALSNSDSGAQFKCAAYDDSSPVMNGYVDPVTYEENIEPNDSAMFAYWPEAGLDAGKTSEYHFIVGVTDSESLDNDLNSVKNKADEIETEEESTTVYFDAGNEVINTFDTADYDTDEEIAAAIYEYAAATTPEKAGNIFKGWYVYALNKNGVTLEEDMLTETGLDGYGTYADFIEETGADEVVVMPKWQAVGTLVEDIADDKGIYTPKAFGLNGLQIRKDKTVDIYDSTIQYGGLRFVSSKAGSYDFIDYGYVVAREDDATLFQEHYGADADTYKIKYNMGNNVERTAETDYRYVTNISMEGTINHRDFNDYSLFTFVIDYEGAEGLKNTNFIVRSYAKYEDDYGIERIYYDDYDGTSVKFGGVCTSYNAINAIA